ncbi:hypothetical protein QBC39DRAFT_348009 [Podospora conica]|nr:hypothetical protein QBC39DRAFT_348009 [Schizothecium conicum]
MAPEREILDSEDDGSDFSPAKPPVADDALMYSREIHDQDDEPDNRPDDNNTATTKDSSLKSTDPVFFQRVYDEQLAAASMQYDPLNPGPDPPSHADQGTGTSSLTSLADLPPQDRKPKRTGTSTLNGMADTSQMTTPSGEPGSRISDPWAVPSSPPARFATANQTPASLNKPSRTYGKRKSINTPLDEMPPTQDPYAFPSTADQEPTPRVRKRMKRATESSVSEENQASNTNYDVPSDDDESMFTRQLTRRATLVDTSSTSVVPDTYATELYLKPSALTASQKQQYQLVSLSSEPGPEPSLPVVLSDATQMQKSSFASTIAYPTPSRYAGGSVERTIDEIPSTEDVDMLPIVPEPVMVDLPSSPDVIGEEPTRSKRARPQSVSREVAPSSQTRVLKKRKTARSTQEDLPGSEPWTPKPVERIEEEAVQDETQHAGPGGEQHPLDKTPPQESSARRRTDRATHPSTELAEVTSPLASTMDPLAYEEEVPETATQAVEEPPAKKRRGRKKKEVAPKETVPDAMMEEPLAKEPPVEEQPVEEPKEAEPDIETPSALETPDNDPPKRKRGRPRKSAATAEPIVIDLDSEPDVPADPAPPVEEEEPAEEPAPKPTPAPKGKKKAPAKRGRKKKQAATTTAKSAEFVPDEEKEEEVETKPLLEIADNIPPRPSSSGRKEIPASDDEDEGGAENDAKLVEKEEVPVKARAVTPVKKEVVKPTVANPASSAAGKGKVPLRVGLSKRSRIAPLLKSLRK